MLGIAKMKSWVAMFAMVLSLIISCQTSIFGAETPPYIWIEGEKFDSKDFEYEFEEGPKALLDLYSEGARFCFTKKVTVPKKTAPPKKGKKAKPTKKPKGELFAENGYTIKYKFTTKDAGKYNFWMRIGFEHIRSPFKWRVDNGEWTDVLPETLVTDLVEPMEYATIGWLNTGTVDLSKGEHNLEINITAPGGNKGNVIMFQMDCCAFVKGEFNPKSKLKPGETYNEKIDRDAEAMVYGNNKDDWNIYKGREEVKLSGLWQVGRWDDPDMEKETYKPVSKNPSETGKTINWMGINVPENSYYARKGVKITGRLEMTKGHRFFYRTKVNVPAEYKDKAFHLHFQATGWIASVFVNGKMAGSRKSVALPWDIDISKFIKVGEVNELVVGIKSPWYAQSTTKVGGRGGPLTLNQKRNLPSRSYKFAGYVDSVFGTDSMSSGIVGNVYLVTTGKVKTTDIFIRTSVQKQQLETDIEIANVGNSSAKAEVICEAIDFKTKEVEKTFTTQQATVPANGKTVIKLSENWTDYKLWWPELNAKVYLMRTTIKVNGKVIDTREDTFGFREVTYDGIHCLLNGIRWHFRQWNGANGNEESFMNTYKKYNFSYVRNFQGGLSKRSRDSYDIYDTNGVPIFAANYFNGMYNTKDVDHPEFFKNTKAHVEQFIKAYRNHPSILLWVLGNETLLIGSGQMASVHNAMYNKESKKLKKAKKEVPPRKEWYESYEDKHMELIELQRKLDPTRRANFDGAGDLGGKNNINCNHYGWLFGVGFPESMYTYRKGEPFYPRSGTAGRWQRYLWSGKNPLIFGEVMFYTLGNPDQGWIGGPKVYDGVSAQNVGAGIYTKIAIEGARWQDVMAMNPFCSPLPGATNSFKPRAVFIREHNNCFYSNGEFKRTIKVFNDGRKTDPLTLKWSIVLNGKKECSGEKTYNIKPGYNQEDTLSTILPKVDARVDGELVMKLYAKGECVYDETRPVSVLAPQLTDKINDKTLAVFDPSGQVCEWLTKQNKTFAKLADLKSIPSNVSVLLIGNNALNSSNRANSAKVVQKFVESGKIVVVLEQEDPFVKTDLPIPGIVIPKNQIEEIPGWGEFDTDAKGRSGSISHPVAPAHPILKGLTSKDFFTWADGEFNFRKSYEAPKSGAINLIQGGASLTLAPMMDLPYGKGRYILSQMLIGSKLGKEPMAEQLLVNTLEWAVSLGGAEAGKTIIAFGGDDQLKGFIETSSIAYTETNAVSDIFKSDNDVAVIHADKDSMNWMANNKSAVNAFCEKGNWVMIVDVTPETIDSFNKIVGFEHRIRSFKMEATKTRNASDFFMMGVTNKDFLQSDPKIMIAPWVNKLAASSKTFKYVLDGKDVASFTKFAPGITPERAEYHQKAVNGLRKFECWKYITSLKTKDSTFDQDLADRIYFRYDKTDSFTSINIWSYMQYKNLENFELIFDGDEANSLKFTLEPHGDKQTFDFEPRTAKEVVFVVKTTNGDAAVDICGVDLIQLIRKAPEFDNGKIIPLTNPGGLIKYPIGKGGILLNQIHYAEELMPGKKIRRLGMTPSEQNLDKKRILYGNILRNLGSSLK